MDGTCYDTYLSLCSPYALPAPWDGLKAAGAFRTPSAAENLLERLLERHDRRSLLRRGLAVRDASSRLQINPLLAPPDAPFVALRGPKGVSDLLTAGGCLRGERWPLFGVLDDEHAREAIRQELKTVFLTGDIDDAIVLRAVGLIAAPVFGLGEFDQREVELLAQHYGLRADACEPLDPSLRPREPHESQAEHLARIKAALKAKGQSLSQFGKGLLDEHADSDSLELMLTNWSPSKLSLGQPEAVRQAAQRFRELAELRNIELLEVYEWPPTEDDVQRFRLAAARREAAWVKEAMLQSLEESGRMLSGVMPVNPPATPVSPLEQLRQVLADDELGVAGRRRRQEALDRCHLAAANRMIEQLLTRADAEADPLRRALVLQLAQLAELSRDKMASVRESFVADRSDSGAKKPARDPKVSELLNIGNQILAVARELNQCTHRNHFGISLAKPTISFPPFGS